MRSVLRMGCFYRRGLGRTRPIKEKLLVLIGALRFDLVYQIYSDWKFAPASNAMGSRASHFTAEIAFVRHDETTAGKQRTAQRCEEAWLEQASLASERSCRKLQEAVAT